MPPFCILVFKELISGRAVFANHQPTKESAQPLISAPDNAPGPGGLAEKERRAGIARGIYRVKRVNVVRRHRRFAVV